MISFGRINPYKFVNSEIELEEYYKYDPVFGNNSWSKINEAIMNNEIPDTWVKGDTKTEYIGGNINSNVEFSIFGFGVDDKYDGSKAGITMGVTNVLPVTYQMNSDGTNTGGAVASDMYFYLMTEIYPSLSEELKNIIIPVNKDGNYSTLWLFIYSDFSTLYQTEIVGGDFWCRGEGKGMFDYITSSGFSALDSPSALKNIKFGFCIGNNEQRNNISYISGITSQFTAAVGETVQARVEGAGSRLVVKTDANEDVESVKVRDLPNGTVCTFVMPNSNVDLSVGAAN